MNDETKPGGPAEQDLIPSNLNFPVVGIGASAGGLAPLIRLFETMPSDSGMAFVVVVHLSPKHTSTLPSLIQAATPMTVVSPEQPMSIEPNTVYVIPPNKMLSMNDSYLRVTELDRPRGKHVAIDLFFRSLAIVHRDRAMAVLLSGTGTDGAVGITRIKEEGGISIAQNPNEAEFDGMPRAAIATGTIDWVLSSNDMSAKLVELWRNARTIDLPEASETPLAGTIPASAQTPKATEESLRDILVFLRMRTGHDFQNYKRATVLRRLERRLQVHGLPNLPAYRAFLHAQPEEAHALLKDLLIGVTNFFRDVEAFDVLQRDVVARLMEEQGGTSGGLRAWVAGCATGEEAYSLAMMMCEEAAALAQPPKIHIFATDIDEAAITHARLGTFPTSIETDVSPTRLRRFFDRESDLYRIRKEVREKVMFAVHNLLHDPPFSRLDLISCRNLLIYLDREVHAEILEMFHFALRPGGYLFLGSSESADTAAQYFSVVDKKHRIYRANMVPRAARYMPSVLTGSAPGLAYKPTPPGPEKRSGGYAELHRRLAEEYAPPSVLVDPDSNIVHLSDRAGRFLQHQAGEPSHNLMTLVRPELRLELRTAVFQATRSGKSVEARRVRMHHEGKDRYITMIARPVHEPDIDARPLVMVLFDEVEDSMTADMHREDRGERDPLLVQLEDELSRTKEQLQNTIEQSDTSTEELKASNEELQAINEELRSTTEELETSKEELQSINEELITVNHELKTKIEETGKINDDLQNLIASTDIATVFVDRAMSIKRYTPHATRLFNLIPTDVGRSLLDITHKLNYDRLADDATEAFQSLRMIEREVSTETGKWYLARVLPYRTTEDRIDGAVLTFVDITGRRKAEETTRLIAESTRDFAIITFDLEGRIGTWNLGAEKIFGYGEAEAIGMPVSQIFVQEDRDNGVVERELSTARLEGRAEDDRWHLRKDGQRVFCSGITSPLHEDNEHIGYAKIARDLTGTRRIEAQRELMLREETARRAQAQKVSDMKDEFFAMVSHELKNPLNLIQLNAELLTRLPEARGLPAVQRAAGIIRNTVSSQAQIIDDLLDLSRINTGKLALHRVAMDWSASLESIVSAMKDDAAAKGVTLSLEIPHEPVTIDADPVRVEQICWNLLVNALKFTPAQGSIRMTLVAESGWARLDVVDTGRGIEAQTLPGIFDMYRQAESPLRAPQGLGVGLAVVRQLVDLHGGRIEASSAGLDQGSTFTVWLPVAGEGTASADAPAEARAAPLHGKRVLVVDDDPHSTDTLRTLLETEGMQVLEAHAGRLALSMLHESGGVDAVITDIAMPHMDGRELLAALRQDRRTQHLPVVAVTGMIRPGDERWLIEAGFEAHLPKPVSIERLLAVLQAALLPSHH
jgi:two-component system, chemotaxis family, CheB/CheR fusion protein